MDRTQRPLRSSDLPARLRSARVKRGFSNSDLSVRAGLDRTTCLAIETRNANAFVGTVDRLARVLGVSPGWLAFGEEVPTAATAAPTERPALFTQALRMLAELDDAEEPEAVGPVRPFSHRRPFCAYPELPPLGLEYDPVLSVLTTGLPARLRRKIGHWLCEVVMAYDAQETPQHLRMLRDLLREAVPAPHQAVVDLVMQTMESDDPVRRCRMALSLIVDGNLPVLMRELEPAMYQKHPEELDAAIDVVVEMLGAEIPSPTSDKQGYMMLMWGDGMDDEEPATGAQ